MKRILYATDLNAHSDRALNRAMMLAILHDAELQVFHVTDARGDDRNAHVSELEEQILNAHLPDMTAEQRAALRHQVKVVTGVPTKALVAAVAEFGPDLVVMGPSRDLTSSALFFGTTVEKTIAQIAAPVLVVKKRPYGHYREALVAFDHTLGARAALELVVGVTRGAELLIVRVTTVDENHAHEMENTQDMVAGHVGMILGKVAAGEGPNTDPQVVIKTGNAGNALLQSHAGSSSDILAFGRTQKTGLKSLVPGSTANLLLGHATCDVLIAGRVDT